MQTGRDDDRDSFGLIDRVTKVGDPFRTARIRNGSASVLARVGDGDQIDIVQSGQNAGVMSTEGPGADNHRFQ